MTRVAVDASALGDGSEFRGIGTYVSHLLEGMAGAPGVDVVALATSGTELPAGVKRVPIVRRAGWRAGFLEHDLKLETELRRAGADVFHSPAQHPVLRSPVPWVQTLHDLTPLLVDDPRLRRDRRRWVRVGHRLGQAAAIIADSRWSADQGITRFELDASRVHVVPLGVDRSFQPAEPRPYPDPPYLLYVGSWGPHKGMQEAMDVAGRLADRGYPHQLRIAGYQDPWMADRMAEHVARTPRPDRVEVLGRVDDLVSLYQAATALVFTSRSEGFGLPLVEAMACATPVVAFANTSIVEVVGDGGILVPDGDVEALAKAVANLIDSEQAWSEWSERGRMRSSTFTWDRTVDATLDILRAAAGG